MLRSALVLSLLAAPIAALAVPQTMQHQGRVFDALGAPLSGSHDLHVAIFDEPTAGASLWSETQTLTFTDGYFSADLGSVTPMDNAAIFDDDSLWFEMSVDTGPPIGRLPLASVPFARRAGSLKGGVVDASEVLVNGTTIIDSAGAVDATSLQVGGTTIVDSSSTIVAPVDWANVANVPQGVVDAGNGGALGGLGCTTDQIAQHNGSNWVCADPVAVTGLQLIGSDLTLDVGGAAFASVQEALDSLKGTIIWGDATVTIQIADGTYTSTSPIRIHHPNGNRIQIVGNTGDPSAVVLQFDNSTGLSLGQGDHLGLLDGVTLRGNGVVGGANYWGIYADWGATALLGGNVVVDNFDDDGITARRGAVVRANNVTVRNVGGDGIFSSLGGTVFADNATIETPGASGLRADWDSLLMSSGSTVSNAGSHGVFATANSTVNAGTATITDPGQDGSQTFWGSYANLTGSTMSDVRDGIRAEAGAMVNADDLVVTTATDDGVESRWGTVVRVEDAAFTGVGDQGIRAHFLATVRATRASIQSANAGANSTWNSMLYIVDGDTTSTNGSGVAASFGGALHAGNVTSDGNGGNGITLTDQALGYANGGDFNNNGGYGVRLRDASHLQYQGGTQSANVLGDYNTEAGVNNEDDTTGSLVQRTND